MDLHHQRETHAYFIAIIIMRIQNAHMRVTFNQKQSNTIVL